MTGVDVSVCIATFRRPAGLRRLLESLEQATKLPDLAIEVIVVDNDAEASARATAMDASASPHFPELHYDVEPRQSISHARNRAVARARGTWVAFIDDDEEAEPGWIDAYWHASRHHAADGFFGPVIPVTEGVAPRWYRSDVFFAYAEHPEGHPIGAESTRTGNAFVRRECLGDAPFDPAFGLTGGSDFELFSRLLEHGARFLWCQGARTRDYIPAERLRLRWLLQRAFRGGYTWTVVDRRKRPGFARDVRRIVRAMAGLTVFALWLPVDALRGWPTLMARLRRLCIQAGHLWAYLGKSVEPYKAPPAQ